MTLSSAARTGFGVAALGGLLAPTLLRAGERPSVEPRAQLYVLRAQGSQMIRLAAADFWMGSTSGEVLEAAALCAREPLAMRCDPQLFADELERHPVHLSAYALDRREVTVQEYEACVRVGRCQPLPSSPARFRQPDYPVTLVSWYEASAYCAFRDARLPTEAEFERAVRGLRGRRFAWGDDPSSRRANHGRLGIDPTDADDGFSELAPVGSFPSGRTPEGFLDLAGNAAEWVLDRYAPGYPEEPARDPSGPDAAQGHDDRVIRGGSYQDPLAELRGAARDVMSPNERRPWLGFRCARTEPQPLTP